MTLKSALQDLRETTLAAVAGLLAKLAYLGSLRRQEGGYKHWGLSLMYGDESSDRALKTAHTEVLSKVLRTPISELEEDLRESSQTGKKLLAPTSQVCRSSSPNSYLHRRTAYPPAISIQCWLRFRRWRRTVSLPLRQLHSHPYNLPNNLRLLGMAQNSYLHRR